MDEEFEDLWRVAESKLKQNKNELQSIINIFPTINKSQCDEYEQQALQAIRTIEQCITDLTQALRTNRSSTSNQQYRAQINVYRQQLKSLQIKFREAMQKQRANTHSMPDKEERQHLLRGNEIMDSTQNALDRSKQVLVETEEIAVDTSNKVDAQGHQLENILSDTHEINDTSARARRIVFGMARRMQTDRIVQAITVTLECAIIAGLLYWKFAK
mmetsp:Transcript_9673/g.14754  ORF Transcript_9673/g.14754 Transcript_9673/m.14754 type:complete len:215 (+) Transcript_9673:39-683(+)|eukprot:CAMPEP_0202687658 /NCGR_PEP_ID=MMETSP1385-20130828/3321_1 /ASSEMBLY_ACC=CAM_ASM_000861 /TAXON_ID=933848 /ORGANISM="Elphidium margaritaceum" /LENGTH=214 /DNA_ID=CAMNT_0049342491 /DNA_START=24 /DNA_END=668 /DNA_ORIENTATION=+